MNGLSLFSGAGIGETYLSDCNVHIIVANELLEKRAALYRALNPSCNMICGDITSPAVFAEIMDAAKGIEFLIASPPCQGMSVAGKNRHPESMLEDRRNFLVNTVFDAIEQLDPSFVLIENVPMLLRFRLPYKGSLCTVTEILKDKFGKEYNIDGRVVDAADYGVPQTRLRAIIKMHKKQYAWNWPPAAAQKVTVRDAIGHLPSLEAGEHSSIKWHYARKHTAENVLCMRNTPTGKSAFANPVYYPKKKDGTRVKGFDSSYRRMKWDAPAPTITIRNDCIASQRNVHPGRLREDGTYSDARVLTPYELMLLTSLPGDWHIPDDTPEILIRQVIGESIPPLMIQKLVGEIVWNKS